MIPDSSNTLGGVALPVQGRWVDQYQWQAAGQTALRALSGGYHVYSIGLSGGRPITLVYALPNSWIYKATLDQLVTLASAAGAQYQLVWFGTTYDVIFRHDDAPALEFSHVESAGVAIDQGVYTGQIKLTEVA